MNMNDALSEYVGNVRKVVDKHKGFTTRWRELAQDRLSREPAHANGNALWLSLEAVDEALTEGREFSWACSDRERIAVLDRCVAKAAGRLT